MAFLYCIVYITSVFIFFELHIAVRHGQHDIAPNPEPNPNSTSQYDKDNMSEKVVRLLNRIIDDPQFTPDQVAKQSKAAMSMCLWVRAMDTYAKVSKVSN